MFSTKCLPFSNERYFERVDNRSSRGSSVKLDHSHSSLLCNIQRMMCSKFFFPITGGLYISISCGIWVFRSNNCSLIGNNCTGLGTGIAIQESPSALIENYCNRNGRGIVIQYSENCNISNNICLNNNEGIVLDHSKSSFVFNNPHSLSMRFLSITLIHH